MLRNCSNLAISALFLMSFGCSSTWHASSNTLVPNAPTTISGPDTLVLGATATFSTGAPESTAQWSVNGLVGGSATFGTIQSSGQYTAPSTMPSTSSSITISYGPSTGQLASTTLDLLNPKPMLTTVNVAPSNGSNYGVTLIGSGFVSNSQVEIGGTVFTPTAISAASITVNIPANLIQGTSAAAAVSNPAPGGGLSNVLDVTNPDASSNVSASVIAAARLLDQAGFGPTMPEILHVQSIGLNQYLQEQFALPPTLMGIIPNYLAMTGDCRPFVQCWPEGKWFKQAMWAPDQLRQKVAFAIDEQWVVSYEMSDAFYLPQFLDSVNKDALGNWRQLMQDVTLSPAMGEFLNMANNVAVPAPGHVNQNYARELMQLFNLGPDRLNQDGSLQLDPNGNLIPVYSDDQVDALARALSGWTYSLQNSDLSCYQPTHIVQPTAGLPNYGAAGFSCNLTPLQNYHDSAEKDLIDGVVLPAGQNIEADLSQALDAVFNDSNLPPFVSRQLIQHLVTSNPSPAYIKRVADVFVNNGSGVRGDMKAIVTAILMDPEARSDDAVDNQSASGGKLREPLLWLVSSIRSLGAQDASPTQMNAGYYVVLGVSGMGQSLFDAGDVTGYFSPSYVIPDTEIPAPEFQLESTAALPQQEQLLKELLVGYFGNAVAIDFSTSGCLGQLLNQSPGTLVDYLNIVLLHGKMDAQMRAMVLGAMQGTAKEQLEDAVETILLSPQYKVMD